MKQPKYNIPINSNQPWIPPHLINARLFPAPSELLLFAKFYKIDHVLFADDSKRCNRSIKYNNNIFINSRATFWDAMILPPFLCKSSSEAILQRFLHEIGHAALNHNGDPSLISSKNGLTINNQSSDRWDVIKGREGECWKFAFHIRLSQNGLYTELLNCINTWQQTHVYADKDWYDDYLTQWKHINKSDFPDNPWTLVPEWVKNEFSNLK